MHTQPKDAQAYFLLKLYQETNPMYTYQNLKDAATTENIIEAVPYENKQIKVMWSMMEDIKDVAGYIYIIIKIKLILLSTLKYQLNYIIKQ